MKQAWWLRYRFRFCFLDAARAGFIQFLAFVVLCMLSLSHANANEKNLIIGYGENAYPSYFFENNQWQGMDVEVIERLVQRAQLASDTVSLKIPSIFKTLTSGRVHIIPNLSKNDKRSEFLDWIGPVRTSAIALITIPEFAHEPITDFDSLVATTQNTEMKIAYITGTSFSASMDAKLAEPAFRDTMFFVAEYGAAKRMLKAGRILGFFYDEFEARAIITAPAQAKKTGFDGFIVHEFRIPRSQAGAYIGVSRQVPENVRATLKREFAAMKQSGELHQIACKWGAVDKASCD
jgi:ABC-type amino acid transport substrate-binding protein